MPPSFTLRIRKTSLYRFHQLQGPLLPHLLPLLPRLFTSYTKHSSSFIDTSKESFPSAFYLKSINDCYHSDFVSSFPFGHIEELYTVIDVAFYDIVPLITFSNRSYFTADPPIKFMGASHSRDTRPARAGLKSKVWLREECF